MVKKKKILSVFLIGFFVNYYVSTNFFGHTHKYAWGTVTHSHPYTSGTHTHSTNALYLIAGFTHLLFVGSGAIFCQALLSASKALYYSIETGCATSLIIGSNPLRAPPVFT
jgi:hypothetical protein